MVKKPVALLVIAFFTFLVFAPANYAAVDAVDDIIVQAQEIYRFMDDYDKGNIRNARTELQNFADNHASDWNAVLGVGTDNNLLTSAVIDGFGDEETARAAIKELFTSLGNVYYSSDSDAIRATINDYKEKYKKDFQKLFGEDITMEELFLLFSDAREALPGVIKDSDAALLANDTNEDLIAKMPVYLESAMNEALRTHGTFSGRLSDINWSTGKLIAQQEILAGKIDSSGKARISLALAAVRWETKLAAGSTNPQVGDKPVYRIEIMGRNATNLLAWESADPAIVKVSKDTTTGKFIIEAIAPGTTQLTIYREYGDPLTHTEHDWLLKFNVTVAKKSGDSPGGGGGGGGGTVITPKPVTSTTGSAEVRPAAGGEISLGNEVSLSIPAQAIAGTAAVEVSITKVEEAKAPETTSGFRVLGNVYELTVGDQSSYSFGKKVTLTFTFDPKALGPDEVPSVHYYDAEKGEWVNLGGAISGNTISIEVDHFTMFAVIAQPKASEIVITLTDIKDHWAQKAIGELVKAGAISGYPDNTFKPDNPITRAEFAVVLVKAFDLKAANGKVFDDTASHWAKDYIAIAAANGIVSGYSEVEFGPDDLITREQMAVMIVKAAKLDLASGELSFSDKADSSSWAADYIVTAVQNKLMSGYPDGTFKPLGNATRAEAVTVIYNALK